MWQSNPFPSLLGATGASGERGANPRPGPIPLPPLLNTKHTLCVRWLVLLCLSLDEPEHMPRSFCILHLCVFERESLIFKVLNVD